MNPAILRLRNRLIRRKLNKYDSVHYKDVRIAPEKTTDYRRGIYKDALTCRICGESFVALYHHIRQVHDLKQYKKEFHIIKDRELFGKDLLERQGEIARNIGISKEAVDARSKFWANPKARKDKSNFMKKEQTKRMKDPEYLKKWVTASKRNRKSLINKVHRKYLEIEKLRKICIVCGKEFKPLSHIRDGFLHHIDSTKRFEKKKCCSRQCQLKYTGMLNQLPERRKHLSEIYWSKHKNDI